MAWNRTLRRVALVLVLVGCTRSQDDVAAPPDEDASAGGVSGIEAGAGGAAGGTGSTDAAIAGHSGAAGDVEAGFGGDMVDMDSGMEPDASRQDEDDAGECDLREFAKAVQLARTGHGSPSSCASPLPMVELGAEMDARAQVRAFIADVVGAPPESFDVHTVECGTSTTVGCARTFQHDLYKSNGILGEALFPAAEQLERCATAVEETIWTPEVDGVTGAPVVCISGVWDAKLVGIAFFNERASCP